MIVANEFTANSPSSLEHVYVHSSSNNYGVLECSRSYNLWSPLSSNKNSMVDEYVFAEVAVVFPKLSVG